ncbi:MAG TPA: ABC transporter permease [Blastocatellia bacterium]|nr:ABC transporter permease [Blastocatellia bacterium]
MQILLQDLRYGARALKKSPNYTLIAVITLGLGIGANTAIFSVLNAALLRPLPYDATRLVAVEAFNPQKEKRAYGTSPADFWDWQEQGRTFEQLSMHSGGGIGVKESERIEVISGARVTVNFFSTFGVQPMLGRAFDNEEGFVNGPRAVVLSHRLWQRRYGGDPQIIGRTLKTSDGAVTVIGVMPPDFKFPSYAEVWTPLARDSGEMKSRAHRYFQAVGRIKQGETIESAQAEMKAIAARLATSYPKDNQGRTAQVTDWRESLARDSRKALLVLMGAVGFVLLIACANVANLLLARAATRRREMAIRLALGATRRMVLRQLMTESLLLSLLGGALGLLLAIWGVEALTRSLPQLNFSFQSLSDLRGEIRVDRVAMLFTLTVSILTGLIFGLAPGWQAAKTDANESLKESGRSGGGAGHQRARHALVVAEIAMALALLVGAGLLINSFTRLLRVDPGYDPQGLMVMPLGFPAQNKYAFAQQVMERVAATPGVTSVALMSFPTLGGLNFPFNREGNPLPDGDAMAAYSAISPSYFRTLKTPLRSGREFDDRDLPNTRPVAIINETMAREYFAGENPIGRKLAIAYLGQRLTPEIVGVVGDVKQEEPSKPTNPEILVPFAQLPWFSGSLLVRSAHPAPLTVKNAVQEAIWSVKPELPESKVEPLTQTLAGQVAEPRLYALLLGVFAVIALTLATVGIFSVTAYSVAQRTNEIGIRMALGAQTGAVLKLVIGQGMKLVASGVAIGLAASFGLTRLMSNMLFGVSAVDPLTFALITLLLVFVALLACWIPARKAMKVDPLVALRCE